MERLDLAAARLSSIGQALACAAIAAMALLLGVEAGLRKAGHPQSWADDTVGLLVLWSAFLAAGAVERHGEQMRMDSVLGLAGPRGRAAVDLVCALFGLGFLGVLGYHAVGVIAGSVRFGKMYPGSLEYPLALSQSAVLVGAALLGLELSLRAWRLARVAGGPA